MALAAVRPARRLRGTLRPPGDKSISHRALLLNAIAAGPARLDNLATGADVESTARCLRDLGVDITGGVVAGAGLRGLRAPAGPLDCGNSGTTMRLLAGLLAGAGVEATLTGDASLSRRPMDRVAEPLARLGARVDAGPPLRVGGARPLRGAELRFATPSAQVKSCLLLAGLYAEGTTRVVEAVRTRDHTERMLAAMGGPITVDGLAVAVERAQRLRPLPLRVPGDFSSAAFWLVAAAVHPDAHLVLEEVGLNPTRTRLLDVLDVRPERVRTEGGEPVGELRARSAGARPALSWEPSWSAELIDELPVLAVMATQLEGTTTITGAAELRVKESDRVAAVAAGLAAMGADIEVLDDGWRITGPARLEGARVGSAGDHRVAMALAVAGLLAKGGTSEIEGADCVAISYPGFWDDLDRLTG